MRQVITSDCIDKLVSWSETWLLSFQPDKCKVLHVGDGQPNDYVLRNENTSHVLDQVKSEKYIGVIFDSKLEFDIHITEKINKANRIFAMIRRLYKFLTKDSFLPLYKGLVRSKLEFANSVWAPYKMKHIEALEKVQ